MIQLLILVLEAAVVVALVLVLFRLRARFGLTPLYIILGAFQPVRMILASVFFVELVPGLPVSPGSEILFIGSLFVILLVYIFEDAIETRNAVYGILLANLTITVMTFVSSKQIILESTFNFFNLPQAVFEKISLMMLLGSVSFFVDTFLLLNIYEKAWKWFREKLFLRIFISILFVLILDSLITTTGAFWGDPHYAGLLGASIIGKLSVAIILTLALTYYVKFSEVSHQEGKPYQDVFDLLSYRQKFELEQQIGAQRENLLRQSEGRFATFAQISPVGIFRTDPAGATTYVNPRWCEIAGMSSEQAMGEGWLNGVHPGDRMKLKQEWENSTQGNRESYANYRFIHPDGFVAWVIGRSVPEEDDQGNILGYVGTITDITDLKKAEAAISESEERFKHLFISSPDAIYLLDPHDPDVDWSIVDCNLAACEMSGYSREELVGKSIYFLDVNKRTGGDLVDYLQSIREQGVYYFETLQQHKDGRLYPVEITTSIVTYGGRELVLGIDRDISKRKEEEAARAKRAVELETLYQTSLEVNSQADLNSLLHAILERAVNLVGVDAGSLFLMQEGGQYLESVLVHNSPDTPKNMRLKLGEGLTGVVAQTKEVVVVDDYQSWSHRVESLRDVNFHRIMGVPLMVQSRVIGVLNVIDRSYTGKFTEEDIRLVSLFADQAALAIENSRLYQGLQLSNLELSTAYEATIEGWSRALDLRDKETEGHTLRVTELTLRMALAMNVKSENLVHIRRGALLHDIGKMGVPDRILLKPDVLTPDEWEIMRKHPVFAYEMLSSVDFLRPSLDIPYCHHEKWDGTGYPRRLRGEEIPLVARIFAVADVWDALTSDRPYRPAWSSERALAYIRAQSGKHFDPAVVQVFLQMIEKIN
ncbi:MAG: PAS domain S-box protein [Anaerolineales bacterium]|nr:PAS domain S-box protein [Anaerolineales bacterium]